METLKLSKKDYYLLEKLLHEGEVVGFPTETVYGLGVIFDNEQAFHKLMDVKNRPQQKPFTLMCDSVEMISKYAEVDEKTANFLSSFMPGALTVILKAKANVPSWVTMDSSMIGVRVSNYQLVNDIISLVNKPLLVPSANKAGEPPLSNWKDVEFVFDGEIGGLIKEDAKGDLPSTIVEIRDIITLIRQGSISFAKIKSAWEEK